LTITNGATPTALVNTLLGSGITASGVVFQGVYGTSSKYQAGSFSAAGTVATNLGFTSGIVLCTGHTGDIPLALATFPGSSNFTSSGLTSTCTNNEVRQSGSCPVYINDVDVLAGSQNYYNAAVLEFDFVPINTNVSFKYVFGSEEYDQNDGSGFPINYNCSSYNDKFGFIISGPGIAGGQGYTNNGRNIARLANGSEVSINSVNNGVVGSSGGSPSASNCSIANSAWTNGSVTAEFKGAIYGIQFNGNTKILTASQSGLTIGSTYHIKLIVTDVNDGAFDSGVFLQAASFTSPVILPVELVSFNAKCNEDYTEVVWETASEKNNDYFLLERASEDLNFETIATIKGSGNSTSLKYYSFKDYKSTEVNYYKLVQVDFDGTRTNSKLILSKNNCKSSFLINNLYYSNATNEVIVSYASEVDQTSEINIFDVLGKLIYSVKYDLIAGKSEFRIPVNNLSNGIHICSVNVQNNNVVKKIFVNSK